MEGRRNSVILTGVMMTLTTASYLWYVNSSNRKQKLDEKPGSTKEHCFKVDSRSVSKLLQLERVRSEDTQDSTEVSESPSTIQDERENEIPVIQQARSAFLLVEDQKRDDPISPVELAARSVDGRTIDSHHQEPLDKEISEVKERAVPGLEEEHEDDSTGTGDVTEECDSRDIMFEGYHDKLNTSSGSADDFHDDLGLSTSCENGATLATKELPVKPMEVADVVAVLLVLLNVFLLHGANMT